MRFAFTLPFLKVNQKLWTKPHVFLRSSIQPYQLEADRDHLFGWVLVRLFGLHLSAIAVFTPAQKIHIKGGNELEFDSIEPNKTGVNTAIQVNLHCQGQR